MPIPRTSDSSTILVMSGLQEVWVIAALPVDHEFLPSPRAEPIHRAGPM